MDRPVAGESRASNTGEDCLPHSCEATTLFRLADFRLEIMQANLNKMSYLYWLSHKANHANFVS